jgi:alkylation response protein AidB-like acyl-CoA dehydrogenase
VDDDLSTDEQVFVDTSARFIADVCPLPRVRERPYDDEAFASAYRKQAGELGWYSLLVPEELGGGSVSGDGVFDAALVAYTRGRWLQPGPFVATNVVAHGLAVAGSAQQRADVLPLLLSGEAQAAWAISDSTGAPALDGVVQARAVGDGYELSGTAAFVQDVDASSWILVTAASADGPSQLLVAPGTPGVTFTALDSLDITRRFADVRFDRARVPASALVGAAGGGAALVDRQLALACVLTVAECVGAMHQELDVTVDYAKQRIAFGRPIGSFQAVKHALADQSLMLEMSKAAALAAARNVGADDGYGSESASMAKAFVGEAAIPLAQQCFQVFGGIGFTWEHDQHLYLRRLTTDAARFGDPAWHRERLCRLAGLVTEEQASEAKEVAR